MPANETARSWKDVFYGMCFEAGEFRIVRGDFYGRRKGIIEWYISRRGEKIAAKESLWEAKRYVDTNYPLPGKEGRDADSKT